MIEKKHINEAAEEHEAIGGGRKAFSFKCGADWATCNRSCINV